MVQPDGCVEGGWGNGPCLPGRLAVLCGRRGRIWACIPAWVTWFHLADWLGQAATVRRTTDDQLHLTGPPLAGPHRGVPAPVLRATLLYRRPFYLYLMASNLALRLSWTYKLSPHLRDHHVVVFLIALAEAFRHVAAAAAAAEAAAWPARGLPDAFWGSSVRGWQPRRARVPCLGPRSSSASTRVIPFMLSFLAAPCCSRRRRFQWLFVRIEVELRKLQGQRPELGVLVPPAGHAAGHAHSSDVPDSGSEDDEHSGGGGGAGGRGAPVSPGHAVVAQMRGLGKQGAGLELPLTNKP